MTTDKFTHSNEDSNSMIAPTWAISLEYVHRKSGRKYLVTDVVWLGDTDEWGIEHTREGSDVKFVRTFKNFFGHEEGTGLMRFVKVQ